MRQNIKVFNLIWEMRLWDECEWSELIGEEDYGVYQLYGDHPVYGTDVLLYIGRAAEQTFGNRLRNRPEWNENNIPRYTRVHFGRLKKTSDAEDMPFVEIIKQAEGLLIASHHPALNKAGVGNTLKAADEHLTILNWDSSGSLALEVSTLRYTYALWP